MKSSLYLFNSILLIGLILSDNPIIAQGKFELSGGFGIPEIINVKLRYGQNIQVGACVHFLYYSAGGIFSEYYSWSGSAEILYHFAGKAKYVEQRTWYLLGGLGYYHIDYLMDIPHEEYDIGFYPRIGRTLNFSKKIGINLDAGIFLPLSAAETYTFDFKVLPSGSIGFFIRL
jgi:hypothetical protein